MAKPFWVTLPGKGPACSAPALRADEDQDGCPVPAAKHKVLLHVGTEHSWKRVTALTVQLQHQTLPCHLPAWDIAKPDTRCNFTQGFRQMPYLLPSPAIIKAEKFKGRKILFIVGLLAKCRVGIFDTLPSAFLCQSLFSTCFHVASEKDKIPFLAKWLWSHFKLGEGCRRRCSSQLLHLKMTLFGCRTSTAAALSPSTLNSVKSWLLRADITQLFSLLELIYFRDALVKSTECSWDVLSQV